MDLVVVILAVLFLIILLSVVPIQLWIVARASGAPVGLGQLVMMKFRKLDFRPIVHAYINAKGMDLGISIKELETHTLAGGSAEKVVTALILAKVNNIEMDFMEACAIDLVGRDVFEEVKTRGNITETAERTPDD